MEGVLVLVVDIYLSFISTSILFLFVFIFLLFPYVLYCLVIVIISIRLNNYNNNKQHMRKKEEKGKKKQQQNNRDRNGLESYRYRKPIDKSHLQSMTHYEGGGTSSSSSSLLKKELDEVHSRPHTASLALSPCYTHIITAVGSSYMIDENDIDPASHHQEIIELSTKDLSKKNYLLIDIVTCAGPD